MPRFVYLLGIAAFSTGCQSETDTPAARERATPAMAEQQVDARDTDIQVDAGAADAQTPSTANEAPQQASTSQCDPMRCERLAQDLARSLMAPAAGFLTVKGGECARVDIVGLVAGMACTCQTSNGWAYIGPEGAGCFARGRAGDCLWDDSEFEPCRRGDPACSAMCAELQKRYAADAAKIFDAEVRFSTCRDGACHQVLRIDEDCYADRSFESGRSFDCKLSDNEILEREATARK